LIITHFGDACLGHRAGKNIYRRDAEGAEGAEKGKRFNTEDAGENRRTQKKREKAQPADQEIGVPRRRSAAGGLVAEEFLAFLAEEAAYDRDTVIALAEDELAGD
jgi:hypothetical protein